MKRTIAILFALAMLTTTLPTVAASGGEEQRWQMTFESEEAFWEYVDAEKTDLRTQLQAPTDMSQAQATDLVKQLIDGEEIAAEDRAELVRYFAQHQRTDAELRTVFEDALGTSLEEAIDEEKDQPAQDDVWNELTVPLTAAYVGAGTVDGEYLPHNFRVLALYFELKFESGHVGDLFSGYFWARATSDILALGSLDIHQTTDELLLQLPVSLEVRLNYRCTWGFFGLICTFWTSFHFPEVLIAQNAAYVTGIPAMTGELATRATDNEIIQEVYDALGTINWQKARQWTSDAVTRGTPAAGSVPGGDPGLGDIHAASPIATYYGAQVDPGVTGKPALMPTPADSAPGISDARDRYDTFNVRERSSFGIAPGDSEGTTVAHEMSQIRAWHLNLAFTRIKTVGATSAGAEAPPLSFYYDAGSYFTGGSGNVLTVDYNADGFPTELV